MSNARNTKGGGSISARPEPGRDEDGSDGRKTSNLSGKKGHDWRVEGSLFLTTFVNGAQVKGTVLHAIDCFIGAGSLCPNAMTLAWRGL